MHSERAYYYTFREDAIIQLMIFLTDGTYINKTMFVEISYYEKI